MKNETMADQAVLQQQLGDVKDDLNKLRADLSEIVRTMMEAGKMEAGEARERIEGKMRQQLEALNDAMASSRERGRILAGRMTDQIEEHPVGSVLGALGVGFLLGMFMTRK